MRAPNNNKQTQVFQRDAKRDDGVYTDKNGGVVRVQRPDWVGENGFVGIGHVNWIVPDDDDERGET
jgi:hypothetical protein